MLLGYHGYNAVFFLISVVVMMAYRSEITAVIETAFDLKLFDQEFVFIFSDFDVEGFVSLVDYVIYLILSHMLALNSPLTFAC